MLTNTLKVLFSVLLVAMGYSVVATQMKTPLFENWDYLAGVPWMKTTLQDFYTNVLVLSAWICYKESKLWKKALWILLLCTLGSIATVAYALIELFKVKPGENPLKVLFAKQN